MNRLTTMLQKKEEACWSSHPSFTFAVIFVRLDSTIVRVRNPGLGTLALLRARKNMHNEA